MTEPEISEVRARRRSTQVRVPHAEPDAEADEAPDARAVGLALDGEPLGRADAGADVRAVALAFGIDSDSEPEPAAESGARARADAFAVRAQRPLPAVPSLP